MAGNTDDLLSIKTIWRCQACGALALSAVGDVAQAALMARVWCGFCAAGHYADVGLLMPLVVERETAPAADDGG